MIPLGVLGSAHVSASSGAVVFSDNFNRADGALGPNWTAGSYAPTISSNRAIATTNSLTFATAVATSPSADMYVQARIKRLSTDSCGVMARTTAGYYWRSLGTSWKLFKFTPSQTELAAFTFTPAGDPLIRIECRGSNIRTYIDGTLYANVTDTEIAEGGVGQFRLYRTSDWLDDFEMGTL